MLKSWKKRTRNDLSISIVWSFHFENRTIVITRQGTDRWWQILCFIEDKYIMGHAPTRKEAFIEFKENLMK